MSKTWKGDVFVVLLVITLTAVLVKGCNVFFPGDSEEPPPSVEESQ